MIVNSRPLSWWRLMWIVRGSAIQHVWKTLLVITAVAVLVTVAHGTIITYVDGKISFFKVSLTTVPFVLMGAPLGIFLGFRNNSSYDRFWEGRKLWGQLVNVSRSITRQLFMFVNAPAAEQERLGKFQREMVYCFISYVHALRMHLRNQVPSDRHFKDIILSDSPEFSIKGNMDHFQEYYRMQAFLLEAGFTQVEAFHNLPLLLLKHIGLRFRKAWLERWIHPYHLSLLEQSITGLTDIQGGCERIKNTPIPFSYTILMHRLVASYCFTLPFGLVDTVGIMTPLVVLLISYTFLGTFQNPG
ncbi:bestrophin family protein [Deltaproteobacteria bacterium TL4]